MASVEVLDLESTADRQRWEELVEEAPTPDIYYRPGYVDACRVAENGRVVGLLVRTHTNSFLIPILLKKIPDLGDADDSGYDGITPYGYGGILPISNNLVTADSAALLVNELRNWCLASQVVSCLIRLHPLLNETAWFGGSKNVDRFGQIGRAHV